MEKIEYYLHWDLKELKISYKGKYKKMEKELSQRSFSRFSDCYALNY